MGKYVSSTVAKHVALAIGAGLVTFIVGIQAAVQLSPYVNSGLDGLLVVLGALGVGYAKRQSN